jgi:peroxiredoxin
VAAILLDDGIIRQLNVEKPRELEVSDARTMIEQLGRG